MGATGTATLDFGVVPGSASASVLVAGQTGILGTSFAEAFMQGDSTGDHNVDEHMAENIKLRVRDIVVGTGFTIVGEVEYGRTLGQYSVRWVWA